MGPSKLKLVIVGGGVIGLSIAYEMRKRGHVVRLLEKGRIGRKASWAGAGMLPPAEGKSAIHPMEHLEAISHELHRAWAAELSELTGIDNGYQACGGLYLARTPGEIAALSGIGWEWQTRGIEFLEADLNRLKVPFSAPSQIRKALLVPSECQINNPRHLEALQKACQLLGVDLLEQVDGLRVDLNRRRISLSLNTSHSTRQLGEDWSFVFAAGPWTEQILSNVEMTLPMQPVRGQMALYQIENQQSGLVGAPIINEGSRYLVPRADGHVLAGSTIEEVGFNESTTEDAVNHIRAWAEGLFDELNESSFQKSWAGLRPATYDGFPYLGQLGEIENAYVATGHFKSGLHLSTGTAQVMADMVEGTSPTFDLIPLSPNRVSPIDSK